MAFHCVAKFRARVKLGRNNVQCVVSYVIRYTSAHGKIHNTALWILRAIVNRTTAETVRIHLFTSREDASRSMLNFSRLSPCKYTREIEWNPSGDVSAERQENCGTKAVSYVLFTLSEHDFKRGITVPFYLEVKRTTEKGVLVR